MDDALIEQLDLRQSPSAFKKIRLSQSIIGDLEIEVEYQGDTIQKFGLDFDGTNFLLATKHTDCLAKDNCGIPAEKPRVKLSQLQETSANCCTPNSGCC